MRPLIHKTRLTAHVILSKSALSLSISQDAHQIAICAFASTDLASPNDELPATAIKGKKHKATTLIILIEKYHLIILLYPHWRKMCIQFLANGILPHRL